MQSIAKSALWVTISEIIFNLSGFVIHAVLGRFLGPADYGRYGIIITLTTMVIILIGNGIPTAMAKYLSEYFETNPRMVGVIKRQAIILQSIIIGSITLLFFLSIPLIAKALGDPTLIPLFRVSTLIIPAFAAASFYFSYYTGLHKFNLQATLKTLRSIFRIGFVIALAYFFRVEGSIIGYILAPTSVFLVAYGIDKIKISREINSRSFASAQDDQFLPSFRWQKLVNYAWQIVVFFLAYELLISIDLYLVKAILGSDEITGIYNAALTVGRIPYYLFYAMTIFLLPMISRSIAQNNHEETKKILNQSLRIMLLFLIPLVVIMSFYSREILFIFYGEKFILGAQAMAVLEYGIGFLTVFYVLSFALNGAGKTKVVMKMAIVGFILNAILNYFLIKEYAILGSAIATSIASLVIMVWILIYLKNNFEAKINFLTFIKILFSSIVIYGASLFFPKGEFIFILNSLALLLLYYFSLYILGEIKKEDLIFLEKIILRKKHSK